MHYKNGREAKIGDRVVGRDGRHLITGVITDLVPGATSCNAYIVPNAPSSLVTLSNCLHVDDAMTAPPAAASTGAA